jgi:hypothetical protein
MKFTFRNQTPHMLELYGVFSSEELSDGELEALKQQMERICLVVYIREPLAGAIVGELDSSEGQSLSDGARVLGEIENTGRCPECGAFGNAYRCTECGNEWISASDDRRCPQCAWPRCKAVRLPRWFAWP